MRWIMSTMLIMWIVWGAVAITLLALLGYRGTLTRYEEDQIFLDEAGNHQAKEQSDILVKIRKIDPFVRVAIGATCAMSVCLLGAYIWAAFRNLA
jgi:hypothetical protein